ncbi:MAG: hypothetical protein ACREJV_02645 [Candidatus Rokuibacteriota bacterium]
MERLLRAGFAVAWLRYRAEVELGYHKGGRLVEDIRQGRQLLNRSPLEYCEPANHEFLDLTPDATARVKPETQMRDIEEMQMREAKKARARRLRRGSHPGGGDRPRHRFLQAAHEVRGVTSHPRGPTPRRVARHVPAVRYPR